jgi:hypothetical protein
MVKVVLVVRGALFFEPKGTTAMPTPLLILQVTTPPPVTPVQLNMAWVLFGIGLAGKEVNVPITTFAIQELPFHVEPTIHNADAGSDASCIAPSFAVKTVEPFEIDCDCVPDTAIENCVPACFTFGLVALEILHVIDELHALAPDAIVQLLAEMVAEGTAQACVLHD